jgi:hypothetical protein
MSPYLDVLVTKKGTMPAIHVYRKPTHTGHYLHFDSDHPPHIKSGVVCSLICRASTICQELKEFLSEVKNIKHEVEVNR